MPQKIDINPQFKKALDLIEKSDQNVFITGRAGTGKSTLLEYFRDTTKKKVVVLAPTGVAALNVKGQTIHSFFRFKPDITLSKVKKAKNKELYQKIDAIIIDEISMVRADLLDCVDKFLRLNRDNQAEPFGGLQVIFFGDLYQLPPVVTSREKRAIQEQYETEYFFSSQVYKEIKIELIELEKHYRQKDQKFIDLLNSIRHNTIVEQDLKLLNQRLNISFEAKPEELYICLTPTNKASQIINEKQLAKLKSKAHYYEGDIQGDFNRSYLSADVDLYVKKGAQVMMLNNDQLKRWVNGSVGRVIDIEEVSDGDDIIMVELNNGDVVEVTPYTWEIFHYSYDSKNNSLESEIVGSFTQYPLKLAWSVTIHKGQGKTFDKVIIDLGRGVFACGQTYVALSRCTTLDGIVLKKEIQKNHIFTDWRVVKFFTGRAYAASEKKLSLDDKVELIQKTIDSQGRLKIVYLKANNIKSERMIEPSYVGELEYLDKPFLGIKAVCLKRQEDRVFRVDRILEMEVVG